MIQDKVDRLIYQDVRIREYLPKEIFDWATKIIEENYQIAKNKDSIVKIRGKITHTKKVLEAGLDIINDSKELNWNKNQAIIICFLHDIGRFQQSAIYNTFRDSKEMDHGNLGSELFKNKGFKVNRKYSCSESEIRKAIKFHNKKDYKGKSIYSKLARDADKLALFRDQRYLFNTDREDGFIGKKLSKTVLQKFLDNKTIGFKIIKTKADIILARTGWMWNLNFEATKKLCRIDKINQSFKEKINKMDIDQKTLDLINKKIDSF